MVPRPLKAGVHHNTPERMKWTRQIEFILACISYAIGLGNVWRYPYLSYRNGGGAFLIPFTIMLLIIAMPFYFLEVGIAQFSGYNPINVFQKMSPMMEGVGYSTIYEIVILTSYYMVVIAWSFLYLFASFQPILGWSHCNHDFNTEECYSEYSNSNCMKTGTENEPMTFWNRSCWPVQKLCSDHGYEMNDEFSCINRTSDQVIRLQEMLHRQLASVEYNRDFAFGIQGHNWDDFGPPYWPLSLCLLLCWVICYFCVMFGVKSVGKAAYFFVIFPYVIILIFTIRGCTLPGALTGVTYYMKPDFAKIGELRVWSDAASQTFYSQGIVCGSLITLASYVKFDNNFHADTLLVCGLNYITSIFTGFAVFSVLGFLAEVKNVSIDEVVESGPNLIFISYPEGILQMPLPQLWSVLFFMMIVTLGIGSQFPGIETMVTVILDEYPNLQPKRPYVCLGVCITCYLLGLPLTCRAGSYLFAVIDDNIVNWNVFVIALGEILTVAWIYGINNFMRDVEMMSIKLRKWVIWYWKITMVGITPVVMFILMIQYMMVYRKSGTLDYEFPDWTFALSILISGTSVLPIFGFMLYRLIKNRTLGKALWHPTHEWRPASLFVSQEEWNRLRPPKTEAISQDKE